MEERKNEGLRSLGHKTEYKSTYDPSVLETFENNHPGNDYWVRFNCPEFTSLWPITGQPDFAEIRIAYIPDKRMVESTDGPEVYRGHRPVCPERRYKYLSLC